MTQEALKLALEALEVATTPLAKDRQEVLRAITAIKEALAQPEQCNYPDCKCPTENPCLKGLAQPEQEPFAYWFKDQNREAPSPRSGWFVHCPCDGKLNGQPGIALYTRPQPNPQPALDAELVNLKLAAGLFAYLSKEGGANAA